MKTTLMFRQMIANPRRTTLAHLKDASELAGTPLAAASAADRAEQEQALAAEAASHELPQRTANPRRTVLNELPPSPVAP
jgi:hypothetical protein